MIRRILGIITVALLLTLGAPAIASAHVLKVDGRIGAVLHINPDDDPIAGADTDYTMTFDDDAGKFSLPKCNCSVAFIVNGKTLTTKPLVVSSNEVSENHYTFPAPAVYTMRFTGVPKVPGAFQPFTLDYEVRVSGGQTKAQPMPLMLWIGMGMMVGLVLLAAFAMDYDNTNKPTKKDKI